MRILVFSDTHGVSFNMKKFIDKHNDVNHIFFLGDLVKDIEQIKENYKFKNFYIVSGNCDSFSFHKNTDIAIINGVKILFTHGHMFGVKAGLTNLKDAAKQRGCSLALFGHTHRSVTIYDDGVYLVNPGSLTRSREGKNSYAIIDVLPNGIVTSIINTD